MPKPYSDDYPPPDFVDPVIEVYKKDIDRTLIRENLKLTVAERWERYEAFLKALDSVRGAALPPSSEHVPSGTP